jgi:hypothetical protein
MLQPLQMALRVSAALDHFVPAPQVGLEARDEGFEFFLLIDQFPIDGGKLLVDLFPLSFVAAPVLLEFLLVALEGDFSLVDPVIEDQDFLLDPAASLLERFDLREHRLVFFVGLDFLQALPGFSELFLALLQLRFLLFVKLVETLETVSIFLHPILPGLEILIEFPCLLGEGLLFVVQGPDVLIDLLKVNEKGHLLFQSLSSTKSCCEAVQKRPDARPPKSRGL